MLYARPMIDGACDARFAAVRDTFAAAFDAGREVGASFAATVDGRTVVDLWGGHADAARTRAWHENTIVNVFSTTKAMTAICAHILVDRGLLDLDAPSSPTGRSSRRRGRRRSRSACC